MLSEISQTQQEKHCMIPFIYGIKKKLNPQKQSRRMVTGAWGLGKMGKCWPKGTFNFKMNKFRMMTTVNNNVLFTLNLLRE